MRSSGLMPSCTRSKRGLLLAIDADMTIRDKACWIAMGGFAFWAPPITLYASFHENTNWVWLNVGSMAGLALLSLVSRIRKSRSPNWLWMLAGVYILGPVSMIIGASFAGGILPSLSRPGDLIFEIVLCLLPPLTLWLSLYNGMFLSVFVATIILGVLATLRHKSRYRQ
jgi:hypothetical protein